MYLMMDTHENIERFKNTMNFHKNIVMQAKFFILFSFMMARKL